MDQIDDERRGGKSVLMRYGPIVGIVAVVALVFALIAGGGDDDGDGDSEPASTEATVGDTAADDTTGATTAPVADTTAPDASLETDTTEPADTTPTTEAFGVAVNGTECGPDVRQFDFSPYSPLCVAAFEGDNGGATSPGVTADEIKVVFRQLDDYDAVAPALGSPTTEQLVADAKVLVDYFNTQFELYGRKVVVDQYKGTGSYVVEAGGGGQDGATADAQTMIDMGAFASGADEVGSFADALAAEGIVHLAVVGNLTSFEEAAPYRYLSLGAQIDVAATGIGDLICQRMANLPAIFAGDDATRGTTRKFAVIDQEVGQDATALVETAEACGIDVEHIKYRIDPATYAQQSSEILTRMKADGVTTVILFTDPVFGTGLTTAAVAAQYTPEWMLSMFNNNAWPRLADAKAVESMISVLPWAPQSQPTEQGDCYAIYKAQSPDTEPATGFNLDALCAHFLPFFGALQAAGPNLTPETFADGWFSLPDSVEAGALGQWIFDDARQSYSPSASYTLQYWDAASTNPADGGQGMYLACDEPANIPFLGADLGEGQLHCFGQ